MRLLFCMFFSFHLTFSLIAQMDTQVYLTEINLTVDGFQVNNIKNISNNSGYNNQPFFKDNNQLFYVRNNSGQNDIALYRLDEKKFEWKNKKTEGGEYSPQPIPNSLDFAAVRLDPDGKQRLYRYFPEGNSSELINDLEVAYYTFFDVQTLVASVLAGNNLDLVVHHFKDTTSYTLLKKTGRSIHVIPDTKAVSYPAVNEDGNYDLYQLDMDSLESFFICQLPIGIQDYAWFDDEKIIIGSGAKLFVYDLFGNGDWQQIADFSNHPLQNITRLSISPDKKHLAFSAEPKP